MTSHRARLTLLSLDKHGSALDRLRAILGSAPSLAVTEEQTLADAQGAAGDTPIVLLVPTAEEAIAHAMQGQSSPSEAAADWSARARHWLAELRPLAPQLLLVSTDALLHHPARCAQELSTRLGVDISAPPSPNADALSEEHWLYRVLVRQVLETNPTWRAVAGEWDAWALQGAPADSPSLEQLEAACRWLQAKSEGSAPQAESHSAEVAELRSRLADSEAQLAELSREVELLQSQLQEQRHEVETHYLNAELQAAEKRSWSKKVARLTDHHRLRERVLAAALLRTADEPPAQSAPSARGAGSSL